MSWSFRRAILVLVLVVVFGSLALLQHALAQKALPIAPPGAPGAPPTTGVSRPGGDRFDFAGLTLPKDEAGLHRKIEAAIDNIGVKDWDRACEVLQSVIKRPDDVFVKLKKSGADGKEVVIYVSVKKEAHRLLASLPKAGREHYEVTFGEIAKEMYDKAKSNNDRVTMGQVLKLYLYTEAGARATEWLGTHMLDRGDYASAARYFKILIQRSGAENLAPATLFKAAYALHQSGDAANEAIAWKALRDQTREVNINDRRVGIDELKDYVQGLVRLSTERSVYDSPLFGGNSQRNGQGFGGTAFLVPRWKEPTFYDGEKASDETSAAKWFKQATSLLKNRNQAILSAHHPITITLKKGGKRVPLVIYRSYWGIHARNVKTGKLKWETGSPWSVERMLRKAGYDDARKSQVLTQWLQAYVTNNQRPQILFENSTIGTLSADDQFVYAVDDLFIPPPAYRSTSYRGGIRRYSSRSYNYGKEINDAIAQNRLQAFSLKRDGALQWEVGGPEDKGPLKDSYFLGPPLPVDDKVYVLNEKQQELRLVCLDPKQSGKVVSIQVLANTRFKMSQEVGRRIRAAHLAFGEGILVCPTNAGAVFGIDLLSNSLVWAYPYREKSAATNPPTYNPRFPGGLPGRGRSTTMPITGLNSHWRVSAPVIQDGRVVFTAPDAKTIHCVRLRDGAPLWVQSRNEEDLYLGGVFKGTVLIVGKKTCRGLSLRDGGKLLWTLDTGIPSGQGVASKNIYYLPLRSASRTKEPEIAAIDVAKGQILAHTRSRKKEVPGNLVFYAGDVLSQTADRMVAYPQLAVKITEMNTLLAKQPNDPVGLTERGELLLDKGELGPAVRDLRRALQQARIPEDTKTKARRKLYEALTEYFQRDFVAAEDYIKEYEDLCKVPGNEVEERRRRSNFLCLVAKGREKQGKLVEAFEYYRQFVEVAGNQELISVVDEPAVKAAPEVWSQGRIEAMVRRARPGERAPLEAMLSKRWKELQDSEKTTTEDLRNFVKTFGSIFSVGKEARLALAERLMRDENPNALLEAEQQLSLLRGPDENPALAARAVEALARLNMRKGLLEDSAYYYRLLGTRYGSVKIKGDMTGEDLLNHMFTDPRLLPHLDVRGQLGAGGDIRYEEVRSSSGYSSSNYSYTFSQTGEPLPFFDRYRFKFRFGSYNQLKLVDSRTDQLKMEPVTLAKTKFQQMLWGRGKPYLRRFSFQNLGHLVVLPVGHMVYGFDPVKGRKLWERNLLVDLNRPGTRGIEYNSSQFWTDPRDGSIHVVYYDGWTQRLGHASRLAGGILCVQTRDALEAIDPLTGKTLWARSDIGPRCHVYNDDEYVYVVELGTDNKASQGRVFRAYDGVTVPVTNFADLYEKRLQVAGRRLLLSETNAKNEVVLRLHDVITGKDLWQQSFATGTTVLKSEHPDLAGVIEPDGQLHVFNMKTQKIVLQKKMVTDHLAKLQSAHLLYDGRYVFVTCNQPTDPNLARLGGVKPALHNYSGMRALPVNGMVYCYELKTGKLRWYNPVMNQMLVLERFEDLGMVLFASRHPMGGFAPSRTQIVDVKAIDKRTGKFVYATQEDRPTIPSNTYFHDLRVDRREGKIELVGTYCTIKLLLNRTAGKGGTKGGRTSRAPTSPFGASTVSAFARP